MPSRDELDYEIVDVFAPRAFAGNPLAVVFDADDLTTAQCQAAPGLLACRVQRRGNPNGPRT